MPETKLVAAIARNALAQRKPKMWNASAPPPPFGLTVLGRYGAKFKVRLGKLTKIADRATILKWAAERRAVGGQVTLWPYMDDSKP